MIDASRLWVAEGIVIGFFVYLIVLARLLPLAGRQRARVLTVGLVCIALTVMLSQLRLSPVLRIVREWLPAIYLVQGYWLCGLFFRRPMRSWEARLMALDRWLFRALNVSVFTTRGPRVILEYFELTYLLAYPFILAAFGLFCWLGFRDDVDNFWTALLIAGYAAYGVLPWIQTRPPRSLERDQPLEAPPPAASPAQRRRAGDHQRAGEHVPERARVDRGRRRARGHRHRTGVRRGAAVTGGQHRGGDGARAVSLRWGQHPGCGDRDRRLVGGVPAPPAPVAVRGETSESHRERR